MAAADYRVMTDATGQTLGKDESLQDIKAAIIALPNATQAAADNANAAAAEARSAVASLGGLVADTYSASGTYNVGDYAYNNGKLYRCIHIITAGEAWTSSHWEEVKLGNEVVELKSDFNEEITMVQDDIGKHNYFKNANVGLLDVTGTGIYRMGYNCGVLPAGSYELSFKRKPGSALALYITTVKNGTYSYVEVNRNNYVFTVDGSTIVIIRSESAWDYYDVKLCNANARDLPEEIDDLKNYMTGFIPSYTFKFTDNVELLKVTSTGVMRYGRNLGVLPEGTYTVNYVSIGTDSLFITRILNGEYSQEEITHNGYTLNADGESEILIRTYNQDVWRFSSVEVLSVYNDIFSPFEEYETEINSSNVSLVQVTATGTMRAGRDLGVLKESIYMITYTGTMNYPIYITKVKDDVYTHEKITQSGFPFYADGQSAIIIRSTDEYWENIVVHVTKESENMVQLINKVNSADSSVYDVCIVGAGAGGIGCAYALKNSGLRIALVDSNTAIGGTHTQAWVNVHAASVPPPFLEDAMKPLFDIGKAKYVDYDYQDISQTGVNWLDTYLRTQFRNDSRDEACVFFEPKAMSEKYTDDIIPYVKAFLGEKIVSANQTDGVVEQVMLESGVIISAKVFIDCTGEDVLLRLVQGTVYRGEDSKTEFETGYGFTEPSAPDTAYPDTLNECELIYRIKEGTESGELPTPTHAQWAQPYTNVNSEKIYVNSCNGFGGVTGLQVINNGYKATMLSMIAALPGYWRLVKANGVVQQGTIDGYTASAFAYKKLYDYAPMLGIRETYRAKCERMLHEADLSVKISSANVLTSNVLDTLIACGNHAADFHGNGHVDFSTVNQNMKPYGVKFGTLVPVGLKNLLVASRGSGFTHIGASTFRLNKNIMEIGWAAGKASQIFIEDGLSDFRSVNPERLVDDEYTAFKKTVETLETIMA